MRVANPRQGDFAEPDQGFKGKGPGLAHLPHRCGTFLQRCNLSPVPGVSRFPRIQRGVIARHQTVCVIEQRDRGEDGQVFAELAMQRRRETTVKG